VAPDHPTEFSAAVGRRVGAGSPLGPYFLHRAEDDVVVGEIGGAFVTPGEIELGYAIVPSCWGRATPRRPCSVSSRGRARCPGWSERGRTTSSTVHQVRRQLT